MRSSQWQAPTGVHPAFAGPNPLPSVSTHFVATHPAFAAWREKKVPLHGRHKTHPQVETPAMPLGTPSTAPSVGEADGEDEYLLVLSPAWAKKLRPTYERLIAPQRKKSDSQRKNKARRESKKRRAKRNKARNVQTTRSDMPSR